MGFGHSAPLVEVNIGLLADQVGVATSDTLDLGQGVHDLALSINVSVEQTQNVLNMRCQIDSLYDTVHRTWNC